MVAFDPFYDVNTEIYNVGFFENLLECFHADCYERLCPLFDNIVNAFRENRELNQVYMKANLIKIKNVVKEENSRKRVPGEKRTIQNNYNQIIACKNYIDQHLAEKCNLSKNFSVGFSRRLLGQHRLNILSRIEWHLRKS